MGVITLSPPHELPFSSNMPPWTDNEDKGKIGREICKTARDSHVTRWSLDLTPLTDGRGKNE
jgi:hypothetical protein